jgi:hypothetical protein
MALIEYRCVRPEHAQRSLHLTLTIYNHKWAFCTHEGPTLEHKWTPTGGITLSELLRLRLSGRRADDARSYAAGTSGGRATKR